MSAVSVRVGRTVEIMGFVDNFAVSTKSGIEIKMTVNNVVCNFKRSVASCSTQSRMNSYELVLVVDRPTAGKATYDIYLSICLSIW